MPESVIAVGKNRGLAQHHEITLLSVADQFNVDPNAPELSSLCNDIQVVPWKPFEPQTLRARLGFMSLTPRWVVDTFSADMPRCVEHILAKGHIDLVIVSQLTMTAYGQFLRRTTNR